MEGDLQLPVMAVTSLTAAGYLAQVVLFTNVVPAGQVHARGVVALQGGKSRVKRGTARAEKMKVKKTKSCILKRLLWVRLKGWSY